MSCVQPGNSHLIADAEVRNIVAVKTGAFYSFVAGEVVHRSFSPSPLPPTAPPHQRKLGNIVKHKQHHSAANTNSTKILVFPSFIVFVLFVLRWDDAIGVKITC